MINEFEWDEENESHIWRRHRITASEAEEAVLDRSFRPRRVRGSEPRRYVFLGYTGGGRRLVVFVDDLGRGVGRVITAREGHKRDVRQFG